MGGILTRNGVREVKDTEMVKEARMVCACCGDAIDKSQYLIEVWNDVYGEKHMRYFHNTDCYGRFNHAKCYKKGGE